MPTTKIPHLIPNPYVAERDPENPEGLVINTGELIPFGNASYVLDEYDRLDRHLLREYKECWCDDLCSDDWATEGIFDLPDCFVLFCTYWEEILPFLYEDEDVDAENLELPYTTVEVIRKPIDRIGRDRLASIFGRNGYVETLDRCDSEENQISGSMISGVCESG